MASPFHYFRKHQKAFLAVAGVIAIFVFVVGDYITSYIGQAAGGGRSPNVKVAEWDGGSMTAQQLELLSQRRYFVSQCLKNLLAFGSQRVVQEGGTPMMPALPNFVLQEGISPKEVRIGVVTTRILAEQAQQAGITVSDSLINQYLQEVSFRRVNGSELVNVLRSVRQGDPNVLIDQLFAGLRELLLGNTYLSSFSADVRNVLPEQRWQDWRRINERIALEVGVLPSSAFVSEVSDPSDAELEAFYEAHKSQVKDSFHLLGGRTMPAPEPGFKEPRRVKLSYILGDVNEWKTKLRDGVTEEEISDYYERNKRTQFVKTGSSVSSFDESLFNTEEPAEQNSPATETDIEESAPGEASDGQSPSGEQPADDRPADEDAGAASRSGSFRLTAFQDATAVSGEQSDEQSDTSETTEEEPSATADADADESVEETGSTDSQGDEGTEEEEVEYEPLDDVKDVIRDRLATDKAVQQLQEIVQRIQGDLQSEYNPYGFKVVSAKSENKAPPAPPESLTNYKERAAQEGLISEETVLLTMRELSETFVGRSMDFQTKSQSTTRAAFTSLELYQPFLAQDLDGNWYVIAKVEDVPERIPALDEIRDEVADAWKLQQAALLAEKKAEELSAGCEKAGGTLADFFAGKPYEVIITDLFSWLTFGNTAMEMQQGARLGEAPPLENVGPDFMSKAFGLSDTDVDWVMNYDRSQAYVFRINRRERTPEELRELFLSEANTWFGVQAFMMARWQNQQRRLVDELTTRVGLDFEKLQEYLEPGGE